MFYIVKTETALIWRKTVQIDNHCIKIKKNIDWLIRDNKHKALKFHLSSICKGVDRLLRHFPFSYHLASDKSLFF